MDDRVGSRAERVRRTQELRRSNAATPMGDSKYVRKSKYPLDWEHDDEYCRDPLPFVQGWFDRESVEEHPG